MSRVTIEESTLEGIADAIREKTSTTSMISPLNMAELIRSISGGQPIPPEPSNIVHVGIGEEYTYHKIKDAENAVLNGGTIIIHEGIYEEYGIGRVNKELTYEGVGKETCIVQNGWGDKDYSVFDLNNANKTVKNLTIHQTDLEPVNPDTESVAYKAYGVHSDAASCEGHIYTIENCIIKNKCFACVGFGLWQDHTIILKDCDLDTYDSNPYNKEMGAYYCHSNTYSDGVTGQNLVLINNTIHAHNTQAIKIDSSKKIDSEMILEFINNTCGSDLYGTTEDCCAVYETEYTKIKSTSTGNNISKLNYKNPASYIAPDGLKNTDYWFVIYNKTRDEYYCGNTTTKLIEGFKSATMQLQLKTEVSSSAINGWKSNDGKSWTQVTTNQPTYGVSALKTNATGETAANYAFSNVQYNDTLILIDIWSKSEFNWIYEPTESPVPPEPTPEPVVPQTGTWQLKGTSGKKYVIFGTDDDNIGNPKYLRMLRTYGFPYTMNTEAENLDRNLGTDIDDAIFTSDDASSIFSSSVTLKEFAKYIISNNLGEVAQHGASDMTLWDSSKLVGDVLTNAYATYTSGGGTKSVDEFKDAILENMKASDIAQGATYVEEKRTELQNALGFSIDTVGCWGGSPTATVDGISINLNGLKTNGYPWRENNYLAASPSIGSFVNNSNTYDLCRITEGVDKVLGYIDRLSVGKCIEFFWHMPFNDEKDISKWRTMFSSVKALVDAGKIEVVTRKQYAELGEYVENPITSITLTRDGKITVGESDDLSKYTIIAKYKDGSSVNVSSEAIVDNSAIDINTVGLYSVSATYRGFNATTSVAVESGSGSDFVDYTFYEGMIMNKSGVVKGDGYGIYVFPIEPGTTYYINSSLNKGGHILAYTDKEVPEVFDSLVDGSTIGNWSKVTNYEVTNPSDKTYAYYYYGGTGANDVTMSKIKI